MSPLLTVLLFFVVFSSSAVIQAEDEMDRTPPLPLSHRTNMEIIRNIQEIMRSRARMERGRSIKEKKLGVAKLMNHLKNRFVTIPFKFNYMAFKPDLL